MHHYIRRLWTLLKVYDIVNRVALWQIVGKAWFSSWLGEYIFRKWHADVKALFNFNSELTEPIDVANGVEEIFSCLFLIQSTSLLKNWALLNLCYESISPAFQLWVYSRVDPYSLFCILAFDPAKNAIQTDAPEGSDTFWWQLWEEIAWAEIGWWNGTR